MKPLVAAAVILVALAAGVQAQTPEIDALRAGLSRVTPRRNSTSGPCTPPDAACQRTTPKRCAGGGWRLSRGTPRRSTTSRSEAKNVYGEFPEPVEGRHSSEACSCRQVAP